MNIFYNNKQSVGLSDKQVNVAHEVACEIAKTGLDAYVTYGVCSIDISFTVNDAIDDGFNKGLFRVFWSSTGNNKVGYLGVALGHSDGYQISRGWIDDLEINDVVNTLQNDCEYYNKTKQRIDKHFPPKQNLTASAM